MQKGFDFNQPFSLIFCSPERKKWDLPSRGSTVAVINLSVSSFQ